MQEVTDAAVLIFLFAFLGVLLLLIASVAFQFWWFVPFVPTSMPIVRTMVEIATLQQGDCVLDLGAGDARILIEAKRTVKEVTCTGYEGAILVWVLGKIRIFFSGFRDIRFRCRNFFRDDLSQADVIFVYLLPHMMEKLAKKFRTELRPGTRIVSHGFRLASVTPAATRDVPMSFGGKTKVYLYVWEGERVAVSE